MRVGIALFLSAALAPAFEETIANRLLGAFEAGSVQLATKYFEEERVEILARRPDLTLRICSYAAECAFRFHGPLSGASDVSALADRLDGLAGQALAAASGNVEAQWAAAEACVFRARTRYLQEPGAPKDLILAAKDIVEATLGSDRAAEGFLRAAELHLEGAHYREGADRASVLDSLAQLEERLKGEEGIGKQARAAVRAAVLLEQVEAAEQKKQAIEKGLATLMPFLVLATPDRHVVRRYNDFVTLAKSNPDLGIETDYHLVAYSLHRGSLEVGVPLSRSFRVLEHDYPGGKSTQPYRMTKDGRELSRVWMRFFMPGQRYPKSSKRVKPADGKSPAKLAKAFMTHDLALFVPKNKRKKKGPRKVKLNRKISAYHYSIWGPWAAKRFRRFRAWFFTDKRYSYSVRVEENGVDLGEETPPELEAMLQGIRLPKR